MLEPGCVSPLAHGALLRGTLIFSALSEEPCQTKLQQAVSKILITCFAISVCTFLNRKISQPSLRHFQPPYHASRLFWIFYNKGAHFGSSWFQVFTSSYYLLFLFVSLGFFPWESESNLPVLARSVSPAPFPRTDAWLLGPGGDSGLCCRRAPSREPFAKLRVI